jgi:hypothetical protein
VKKAATISEYDIGLSSGNTKPTQNYVKSFNFYSWREIRDQLSVSIHNFDDGEVLFLGGKRKT